ncbi:interleukin-10-like [Misgurnus anguillicaudatus]|uniref:interleukin-10-like n=1 Tax=Misgurnus anguillicaudatus TaxID=75329 RepID=UPI003CCF800D
MNFSGVILSAVLVLLLSLTAQYRKTNCKCDCCTFVEGFPARLKELRSSCNTEILKFYESNDDHEALIDDTVQHNINGPYGCHVLDEILRFYLNTVLTTAVKNHAHIKTHIDSIGNIFQSLQRFMRKCRNYLFCHKLFEIISLKSLGFDVRPTLDFAVRPALCFGVNLTLGFDVSLALGFDSFREA